MGERVIDPDLPQTIPGVLARAAERFGDREALVDERDRLTYAELADGRVSRRSGADRLGHRARAIASSIWAPNTTEWVIAALGIYRAGAVLIVPLNTRFKARGSGVHPRPGATSAPVHRHRLPRHRLRRAARARSSAPPSLREIVVLRGAPADGHRRPGRSSWRARSRRRADGRGARSARSTGDDLSDILFTSGTTGRAEGRDAHARGERPRVRRVVRRRRAPRRRPLPDRQPVLPRVRPEGRHPRLHHHGRDDRARTRCSTSTR